MPELKSFDDLKAWRQQIQEGMRVQLETGTTISIGMGTCGIAAGARETLAAIRQELAKRQIEANVVTVGCIGICVKEPLVDIRQAGKPRIVYANVQPEMVPKLIEDHLLKGQPVKQWVVGRMTE